MKTRTTNNNKQYYICVSGFSSIEDEDYAYPVGDDELKESIEWIKENMNWVDDYDICIFELTNKKVKTVTTTTIDITEN